MKSLVRWSGLVVALSLPLEFTPAARGQPPKERGDAGRPGRTITVTGVGSAKVVADQVRLTFSVPVAGDTPKLGHDALQTTLKQFREAVAGLEIASLSMRDGPVEVVKQIPSMRSRLAVIRPNLPGVMPPDPKTMYLVSQSFGITLKNDRRERGFAPLLEQMSRVILAAAENGAAVAVEPEEDGSAVAALRRRSPAGAPVFSNADENAFRKQALDLALADALANAERVAGRAKVRILRTTQITQAAEGPGPVIDPISGTRRGDYDPITGEKEIVVHVIVTCEY
jgi:uncharacterized protein YggE